MPRVRPPVAPPRRRWLVFAVISVLVVASLVGYLVVERQQRAAAEQAAAEREAGTTRLTVDEVAGAAHLVVRNTEAGPSYGHVALVPLADPGGPRAILPITCQRISAAGGGGICLRGGDGPITDHRAVLLGADLSEATDLSLGGLPSRARVSAAGSYAASTVFVTGHAYTVAGFSTETLIYDLAAQEVIDNVEDWTTVREGQPVTAVDRNYWGISFVGDGPRFFATMGTGGTTYLVEGDIGTQQMTVVQENAACPSVSPDGTRVVYKQRDPETGDAPLVMLDLRSGAITPLGETRPVDDQVTWLDDDTVAYAVGQGASSFVDFDIWAVSVDGGQPRLIVPDAASPSVVTVP
ncbi:MAG: hypothetical protein H0V67_11075 [Geodermatophilaceae bacterium]|nr:hypothetical protein [Geodermatophilaceae bacterium]